MRGMKWTRAACACRRFGLSGDDEAARVIADSNKSGTVCGELDRSTQLGTLLEKLGLCPVQSSSGQQKAGLLMLT